MKNSVDISAVICTRNRGTLIVATLESILVNTHPNFEVVVIDQSTDNVTETAVKPFLSHPAIRYIRTDTVGTGMARQIGLTQAQGTIIAYTDDDCIVPPNWLQVFEDIFKSHPQVAVAFCNVLPAKHDKTGGFIPSYKRKGEKIVKNMWDKCFARGIGAGMSVRRELALKIGGFDIFLGPGNHFPDCEDGDIAVRALLNGWWVYETATIAVTHDGFRTWEEGKLLTRRNWIGIGAAYSKPIKCGYWKASIVVLYEFVLAVGKPISKLLRLQRPQGTFSVYYFIRGFVQGLARPVDREKIVFL